MKYWLPNEAPGRDVKLHIIIEMLEWKLDPPEIAVAGTIGYIIHKPMCIIQNGC